MDWTNLRFPVTEKKIETILFLNSLYNFRNKRNF